MRQIALRAMVTATVTAMLIALLPGLAQASPWVQVFVENQPAGTCLAIANSADGTVPTHDPCVDTAFQLWTFEDTVAAGRYRIVSTATGKCLASNGISVVQQLTCGGGTTQQWTLLGSGNTFRIVNFSVGKCIARQGATGIVLGSCLVSVAQWHLLF